MVMLVRKHVFKLPDVPPVPESLNVKVYLKSTISTDVSTSPELEASPEAVKQHFEMTGLTPQVGKPLYANRSGVPVPYGEVVRVDNQES
jgi:hypothetical protein